MMWLRLQTLALGQGRRACCVWFVKDLDLDLDLSWRHVCVQITTMHTALLRCRLRRLLYVPLPPARVALAMRLAASGTAPA